MERVKVRSGDLAPLPNTPSAYPRDAELWMMSHFGTQKVTILLQSQLQNSDID